MQPSIASGCQEVGLYYVKLRIYMEDCEGGGHACRSGLIVYSTMLSGDQLSDGTNLNLGLSVHDAATVSTLSKKALITSCGF